MAPTTDRPLASAYELLGQHRLPKDSIPAEGELLDVCSTLGGVDEFLIEPLLEAVVKRVRDEDAPRLTYEQVGLLLMWCDMMREVLAIAVGHVEKIALAAHEFQGIGGLPFTHGGFVIDQEAYARLRQEYSFDV